MELTNVCFSYRHVAAVRELSLCVRDEEFIVILGPSGCGKSTTLRLMAGLEAPETGQIAIAGSDVTQHGPQERDVAFVFQSYALYPHMTVRENVEFPLKMRGISKQERTAHAERVATSLGLSEVLARYPSQLSGGQRQRVALGRAIVREPAVFLLDEPLSNLDAQLRIEMRLELARLQRELGGTFVFVTHDQTEALTLADRIAVMKDGRLLQYAEPSVVYGRPANAFVARFVGFPPMNILAGKIVGDGGTGAAFEGGALRLLVDRRVNLPSSGDVMMGFRASNVQVSSDGAHCAIVDMVEVLGSEAYAYALTAQSGGERVVVQLPRGVRPGVGQEIRYDLHPDMCHWFDREDGSRL
jgi:ABC-type sugar transport system ATPase subunit